MWDIVRSGGVAGSAFKFSSSDKVRMEKGENKKTPPLLKVILQKEYKPQWKTLDVEPLIIVKDNTCSLFLHSLKDEDIVGINQKGMEAILNGAVPPETSWLKYLYRPLRTGNAQPAYYTSKYPKQTAWISLIQDSLLKEKVGVHGNYSEEALKAKGISITVQKSLQLPRFVNPVPSFQSELVKKYVWVIQKFNIDVENFEELLDALDEEEKSVVTELLTIEDVYTYDAMRSGLSADLQKVLPQNE